MVKIKNLIKNLKWRGKKEKLATVKEVKEKEGGIEMVLTPIDQNLGPLYFHEYQLADTITSIDSEDGQILGACYWLVQNKETIRVTAKKFEYGSFSNFHKKIHKDCSRLSPELYAVICRQLQENHVRGMHW